MVCLPRQTLGTYVLTELLMPALRASTPSRIIVVSSGGSAPRARISLRVILLRQAQGVGRMTLESASGSCCSGSGGRMTLEVVGQHPNKGQTLNSAVLPEELELQGSAMAWGVP